MRVDRYEVRRKQLLESRDAVKAARPVRRGDDGKGVKSHLASVLPYFLGLAEKPVYNETDLEQALIDHLQEFMQELGRDFCFVERQFRMTVESEHHYLDLLFYHRSLQCLIAIDLKLGKFKHDYAGQMNFYLNYLRENVAYPHENPPVGIILCAERDAETVRYATAGLDNQLFVSRYLIALPSEDLLKQWLRDEQDRLEP